MVSRGLCGGCQVFKMRMGLLSSITTPVEMGLILGTGRSTCRIRLNFTCSRNEPRTMRLLARRHYRLIDARHRNNRNFARFGTSFTPSL